MANVRDACGSPGCESAKRFFGYVAFCEFTAYLIQREVFQPGDVILLSGFVRHLEGGADDKDKVTDLIREPINGLWGCSRDFLIREVDDICPS